MQQIFIEPDKQIFSDLQAFPGTSWSVLSEPVKDGSIHRLKMKKGTVIPRHTHPCDEYVFLLSGTIKTGPNICQAGTFWKTPAGCQQGPHKAITDIELITIRLGAMGEFEMSSD